MLTTKKTQQNLVKKSRPDHTIDDNTRYGLLMKLVNGSAISKTVYEGSARKDTALHYVDFLLKESVLAVQRDEALMANAENFLGELIKIQEAFSGSIDDGSIGVVCFQAHLLGFRLVKGADKVTYMITNRGSGSDNHERKVKVGIDGSVDYASRVKDKRAGIFAISTTPSHWTCITKNTRQEDKHIPTPDNDWEILVESNNWSSRITSIDDLYQRIRLVCDIGGRVSKIDRRYDAMFGEMKSQQSGNCTILSVMALLATFCKSQNQYKKLKLIIKTIGLQYELKSYNGMSPSQKERFHTGLAYVYDSVKRLPTPKRDKETLAVKVFLENSLKCIRSGMQDYVKTCSENVLRSALQTASIATEYNKDLFFIEEQDPSPDPILEGDGFEQILKYLNVRSKNIKPENFAHDKILVFCFSQLLSQVEAKKSNHMSMVQLRHTMTSLISQLSGCHTSIVIGGCLAYLHANAQAALSCHEIGEYRDERFRELLSLYVGIIRHYVNHARENITYTQMDTDVNVYMLERTLLTCLEKSELKDSGIDHFLEKGDMDKFRKSKDFISCTITKKKWEYSSEDGGLSILELIDYINHADKAYDFYTIGIREEYIPTLEYLRSLNTPEAKEIVEETIALCRKYEPIMRFINAHDKPVIYCMPVKAMKIIKKDVINKYRGSFIDTQFGDEKVITQPFSYALAGRGLQNGLFNDKQPERKSEQMLWTMSTLGWRALACDVMTNSEIFTSSVYLRPLCDSGIPITQEVLRKKAAEVKQYFCTLIAKKDADENIHNFGETCLLAIQKAEDSDEGHLILMITCLRLYMDHLRHLKSSSPYLTDEYISTWGEHVYNVTTKHLEATSWGIIHALCRLLQSTLMLSNPTGSTEDIWIKLYVNYTISYFYAITKGTMEDVDLVQQAEIDRSHQLLELHRRHIGACTAICDFSENNCLDIGGDCEVTLCGDGTLIFEHASIDRDSISIGKLQAGPIILPNETNTIWIKKSKHWPLFAPCPQEIKEPKLSDGFSFQFKNQRYELKYDGLHVQFGKNWYKVVSSKACLTTSQYSLFPDYKPDCRVYHCQDNGHLLLHATGSAVFYSASKFGRFAMTIEQQLDAKSGVIIHRIDDIYNLIDSSSTVSGYDSTNYTTHTMIEISGGRKRYHVPFGLMCKRVNSSWVIASDRYNGLLVKDTNADRMILYSNQSQEYTVLLRPDNALWTGEPPVKNYKTLSFNASGRLVKIEDADALLIYLMQSVRRDQPINADVLNFLSAVTTATPSYTRYYVNAICSASCDIGSPNHAAMALYLLKHMLSADPFLIENDTSKGSLCKLLERYLSQERKVTLTKLPRKDLEVLMRYLWCDIHEKNPYEYKYNDKELAEESADAIRDMKRYGRVYTSKAFPRVSILCDSKMEDDPTYTLAVSKPKREPFDMSDRLKDLSDKLEKDVYSKLEIEEDWASMTSYPTSEYSLGKITGRLRESERVIGAINTCHTAQKKQVQKAFEERGFLQVIQSWISDNLLAFKDTYGQLRELVSETTLSLTYPFIDPDAVLDRTWMELYKDLLKDDQNLAAHFHVSEKEVMTLRQLFLDLIWLQTEIAHWYRVDEDYQNKDYEKACDRVLSKRGYKPSSETWYLMLQELGLDIRFRARQVEIAMNLQNPGVIDSLPIGGGKTAMLPACLMTALMVRDKKCMLILPESLVATQGSLIRSMMCSIYGVSMSCLLIDDFNFSDQKRAQTYVNLLLKERLILTTKETLQGLCNVWVEQRAKRITHPLSNIIDIIRGFQIFVDEVDSVFSLYNKVVFSLNEQKNLEPKYFRFFKKAYEVMTIDVVNQTGKEFDFSDYKSSLEALVGHISHGSDTVSQYLMQLNNTTMDNDEQLLQWKDMIHRLLPMVAEMSYGKDWGTNEIGIAQPRDNGQETDMHFQDQSLKILLSMIAADRYKTRNIIEKIWPDILRNYKRCESTDQIKDAILYKIYGTTLQDYDFSDQEDIDRFKERLIDKCETSLARNRIQFLLNACLDNLVFKNMEYQERSVESCGGDIAVFTGNKGVSGMTATTTEVLNKEKIVSRVDLSYQILGPLEKQKDMGFSALSTNSFSEEEYLANLEALSHSETQMVIDPDEMCKSIKQFHEKVYRAISKKNKSLKWVLYFSEGQFTGWNVDTGTTKKLGNSSLGYLRSELACEQNAWLVCVDSARSRGFDIVLSEKAHMILLLTQYTTLHDMIQAIGRLRMLERGQTVSFIVTKLLADRLKDLSLSSIIHYFSEKYEHDYHLNQKELKKQRDDTKRKVKINKYGEITVVPEAFFKEYDPYKIDPYQERQGSTRIVEVEVIRIKQKAIGASLGVIEGKYQPDWDNQRGEEYGGIYFSKNITKKGSADLARHPARRVTIDTRQGEDKLVVLSMDEKLPKRQLDFYTHDIVNDNLGKIDDKTKQFLKEKCGWLFIYNNAIKHAIKQDKLGNLKGIIDPWRDEKAILGSLKAYDPNSEGRDISHSLFDRFLSRYKVISRGTNRLAAHQRGAAVRGVHHKNFCGMLNDHLCTTAEPQRSKSNVLKLAAEILTLLSRTSGYGVKNGLFNQHQWIVYQDKALKDQQYGRETALDGLKNRVALNHDTGERIDCTHNAWHKKANSQRTLAWKNWLSVLSKDIEACLQSKHNLNKEGCIRIHKNLMMGLKNLPYYKNRPIDFSVASIRVAFTKEKALMESVAQKSKELAKHIENQKGLHETVQDLISEAIDSASTKIKKQKDSIPTDTDQRRKYQGGDVKNAVGLRKLYLTYKDLYLSRIPSAEKIQTMTRKVLGKHAYQRKRKAAIALQAKSRQCIAKSTKEGLEKKKRFRLGKLIPHIQLALASLNQGLRSLFNLILCAQSMVIKSLRHAIAYVFTALTLRNSSMTMPFSTIKNCASQWHPGYNKNAARYPLWKARSSGIKRYSRRQVHRLSR